MSNILVPRQFRLLIILGDPLRASALGRERLSRKDAINVQTGDLLV